MGADVLSVTFGDPRPCVVTTDVAGDTYEMLRALVGEWAIDEVRRRCREWPLHQREAAWMVLTEYLGGTSRCWLPKKQVRGG